jgi:hypothetical protein
MIVDNKIVPATNEMISYACKNYHYSKSASVGRRMAFAIFEEEKFIGVIIYSTGATPNIGKPFKLEQGQVIELTRVALKDHKNYVSYYIAKTLKIIKHKSPRVKIIVSYADKDLQNHHGGIYQATNWIYLGVSEINNYEYYFKDKWTHNKTINDYGGKKKEFLLSNLPKRKCGHKHKYIYCIDKDLREKYMLQSKPYPKKVNMDQSV